MRLWEQSLFVELDRVLIIDSPSAQLLLYDMTFQLGDFYVSTLAFTHTLFKEAPVIPVCFLMHERKFEAFAASWCLLCANAHSP